MWKISARILEKKEKKDSALGKGSDREEKNPPAPRKCMYELKKEKPGQTFGKGRYSRLQNRTDEKQAK
jgi:hypothetical protein